MGKAGKWVMNFLLGMKLQGGNNKKVSSSTSKRDSSNIGVSSSFQEDYSLETAATSSVLPPQTPTHHHHKRRWSFGKSSTKDKPSASPNTTIPTFNPLLQASSVDAIEKLLLGPSLANSEAVALAINEAIKNYERKLNPSSAAEEDRLPRIVAGEHVAATRIQAAFRSYLARKALAALKALVKLQALARGHLVRKHMSDTIRKMHAVMAIQVRARFQRIQMTNHSQLQEQDEDEDEDEEQVVDRSSKVGASLPHNKRIEGAQIGFVQKKKKKNKDGNLNDSKSMPTRRHSGDLSFLKREQAYDESTTYSYASTQASPASATSRHYRASQQAVSNQESFLEPGYMGKTQSSRAKSRSLSEPRQRPRKSISSNAKRSPSCDGTNSVQSETPRLGFSSSTSQSKRVPVGEIKEQWFIKLYRSTVAPPSSSSQGGADYYCHGDREILVACEPPLNMY